ncbi:MAG: VWA domain-containing protein [Holophagales bacterium]|nr:MAG: VWA domain-containing protein [Holophagales bacterium]
MPTPLRRLAASLLLSLLPLATGAQTPPPPSSPIFGETVEVNVVNVEVIVVDKDGRPVVGLGRNDFELLEEGKPVPIEYFSAPEPGAVFVPLPGAPATATPEPVVAPSGEVTLPPQRPLLVVYVDGLDLRPGPRNDSLKRLARLVEDRMKIGHRALVAAFDHQLRVLTPATDDSKLVQRAIEEIKTINPGGTGLQLRRRTLLAEIQSTFAGDPTGIAQAGLLLHDIESYAAAETVERRAAMVALSDLLATLAGVDGPKAVLHLSGGLYVQPGDELYSAWQRHFGSLVASDLDHRRAGGDPDATMLQRELTRVTRSAQASRAVIYAVDGADRLPEGFTAEDQGEVESTGDMPGVLGAAEAASNLASMAERSGGRKLLAGPGLDAELGNVASELASAYSLGFTPHGTVDDKFHKVTVRVKREGVKVRHREGYRRRSTEDQLADTAVAAASLGAAPNPLAARLEVIVGAASKGNGKARIVQALAKVPLTELTLMPAKDTKTGKLVLEFALRDEDGRVSRFERREQSFTFPAANLAAAINRPVAYGVEMRLNPGRYRLAASILDGIGGNRTTATAEFTVPGRR